MKPRIFVLSGIYGVGKTSLSHQLSIDLDIRQRAGLGMITKTIKTIIPDNEIVKGWGIYKSIDKEEIRKKFVDECKLVGLILNNIINFAYKTGEDYIIDGVQLLPQFLPLDKINFCVVTVSDEDEKQRRFVSPTVTRVRHLNSINQETRNTIESVILEEAIKYNIPVFDNLGLIQEISKQISSYFNNFKK